MLSRRAKRAFYLAAWPFMVINGIRYRLFQQPNRTGLRVHLGPGQKNYIEGWINVDANMFTGKCDIWADLTNKLPFKDSSVDLFYSHHVIEHLPSIQNHLTDVFRCLKPGGYYRFGGPNGDSAIRKFIEADTDWFSDFPDKRYSIGGRLENFIFCRGEHLTLLTYSFIEEILTQSGFVDIKHLLPTKMSHSGYQDCLKYEWESDFENPHTLIIEARKPH